METPTKNEIQRKLVEIDEWKRKGLIRAHEIYLDSKKQIRDKHAAQKKRLTRYLEVIQGEEELDESGSTS